MTFINDTNFEAQLKAVTSGANKDIRWDMPSIGHGQRIKRTWENTTLGFGTAHLLVTNTSNNSHQGITFDLQKDKLYNEGKPWKPFEEEDRKAHSKTTPAFKVTLDFGGKYIESLIYGNYYTDIKVTLSEEPVNL